MNLKPFIPLEGESLTLPQTTVPPDAVPPTADQYIFCYLPNFYIYGLGYSNWLGYLETQILSLDTQTTNLDNKHGWSLLNFANRLWLLRSLSYSTGLETVIPRSSTGLGYWDGVLLHLANPLVLLR